jgi:hypothetical protein
MPSLSRSRERIFSCSDGRQSGVEHIGKSAVVSPDIVEHSNSKQKRQIKRRKGENGEAECIN